jgi:hypothetical protein
VNFVDAKDAKEGGNRPHFKTRTFEGATFVNLGPPSGIRPAGSIFFFPCAFALDAIFLRDR